MDEELNAAALEVQRMAAQAQAELMRLIALTDTLLTVQQVKTIQQRFNAAFVDLMVARLNNVPNSGNVWDVRMVKAMKVGDLSLSQRLYTNASQTASHVAALVKEHAQGQMQARELAIRLYDGYNAKDGIVRPLEGAARAQLPKALKQLTANPVDRAALQQVFEQGQRYAQTLKTEPLKAAYLQALKAWEDGKGFAPLQRGLEIAHREKTRYVANRIAQTELARAHQHALADTLMADETISVVQVQMSAAHPKTDICDLHSKADLFNLGPGNYPKSKAPKPPFHPFCRCRLRSRPSLTEAIAREKPGGDAAYLRSLPTKEAIQIAGSRNRLQKLLNGEKLDDVVNEGRDALYRLERLGAISTDMQSESGKVKPMKATIDIKAETKLSKHDGDARAYVLGNGRKTGNEYLYAYDAKTGKAIAMHTDNLPNGVNMPDSIKTLLADRSQKVVVHHNHPSSLAPSAKDLDYLGASQGMAVAFVHGHDDSFYKIAALQRGNIEKALEATANSVRRFARANDFAGYSEDQFNWIVSAARVVAFKKAGIIELSTNVLGSTKFGSQVELMSSFIYHDIINATKRK